jgi:hypothetical protein
MGRPDGTSAHQPGSVTDAAVEAAAQVQNHGVGVRGQVVAYRVVNCLGTTDDQRLVAPQLLEPCES